MSILFLDSSAIIEFIKGNQKIVKRVSESEQICTSVICAYETLLGEKYLELKGIRSKFQQIAKLFAAIDTMPLTYGDSELAASISAELMLRGKKVEGFDLIISAQALSKDATLLTLDNHFDVVKKEIGLKVELIR